MGPKSNREKLRDAVHDFNLEYDYNRVDVEMLESISHLADDFMAEQEDQLTDAEIDRLIAETKSNQ
jgi:hypothetical protein